MKFRQFKIKFKDAVSNSHFQEESSDGLVDLNVF